MVFYRRTFLVAIYRKTCNILMINFLMTMEKAVCTLGSITLQDKKLKSNNYQFLYVPRLINILLLFCCDILTGSKDTVQ